MGGPMGVYEQDRFPFLKDELNLLERALADHAPVRGICLGSQLLATALGGAVQRGPRKEIDWHRVSLKPDVASDALLRVSPPGFDAFHWHGDMYELPAKSTSLARSNLTACQAFRYGENTYGILFHLEVTFASVAGMMEAFAEELRAEGIDASELAAQTESALPLLQSIGNGMFRNWAQIPCAVVTPAWRCDSWR